MLKSRKLGLLILTAFFLTIWTGLGIAQARAATMPTDISGHWAQSQIEKLVGQGVISGNPDGTFKPDNSVTRAEFIVMINRAFSFNNTVAINYTDVNSGDWFAPDIAKAVAAGYSVGSNGMMNPNAFITRAEAATMLAQAAKLDTSAGADSLVKFKDAANIPVWSQKFVAAVVKAGYMNGYPDGNFVASDLTTKAMAAVMLNHEVMPAKVTVYNQAGTFGPQTGSTTIDGNVTIGASGVILQNTIINGDLLIAEAVGDGNVTLKNVTVRGDTVINGGGAHSITLDGSTLGTVTSNKANVHISCVNGSSVVSLTLANGATVDVAPGATVEGVTVSATGQVTLSGDFGSVTLEGANANVSLTSGTIANLTTATSAVNATINIAGGATVTTFTANAAASVTGTGSITTDNSTVPATKADTITSGPGATPPSNSGGGGGGGGTTTYPIVVSFTANNLTVAPSGASSTYTVGPLTPAAATIGTVTINFNEAIKTASSSDFNLRAYNRAGTLLVWPPGMEAFAKGLVYSHFGGPNSSSLTLNIHNDYALIKGAMDFCLGADVGSIQLDYYDLAGHMSTLTINFI